MVESKPSINLKEISWRNQLTKKWQAPKSNKYRGKNTWTKYQVLEPKSKTNFKVWCSDLEGCIFDLGPRASDKFYSMMKDMEQYLGDNYSDICQPAIMTKTPANFSEPEIPTIIPETGVEFPKTDMEMTYLKNKTIDKYIRQKPKKKDVYKIDMPNNYNIIVVQKNEQLQEKAALDVTLQAIKTGRDPIRYLMILKKLYLSNQYEQHPIISIWRETRRLHKKI